jgi:hypothetical protein
LIWERFSVPQVVVMEVAVEDTAKVRVTWSGSVHEVASFLATSEIVEALKVVAGAEGR